MLIRNIPCIIRNISFDKLLELLCWILPGDCRFSKLRFMSSGVVLCDHRSECSDSCLCPWHIPGFVWIDRLLGLSSWVVLCDHWSLCSNWSMRRGVILCCFSICVFKLSSCDVSSFNWLNCVFCMSSGVVLCDGGFVSC